MSSDLSIVQFLQQTADDLEMAFRTLFPDWWPLESTLKEAMEYSLFAGGKRIRPALLFATLESLGVPAKHGLRAACSIEMIHTYSLIHDDLPAMDDDDTRRGKPTNHIVYGEALAILAGDGLLTHAFYNMTRIAEDADTLHIPAERVLAAVAELAKYAGLCGMVTGQAADIKGERGVTSLEELKAIHRDKTGALIACSLTIGGIIGGANPLQLTALADFGFKLGLAFQIQDDVLDLTAHPDKLGKPLNSDQKSEKVTYPFFLGIDGSLAEVARLTHEARHSIQQADFPDPQRLLQISDFLMKREY